MENVEDEDNSRQGEDSEALKSLKRKAKALSERYYGAGLLTTLTPTKGGIVDICMKTKEAEETSDSLAELTQHLRAFTGSVVLRGSVRETGGIHSFWVQSRQKNLIACLFELPEKEVGIGDTWELETNFIGNDQNFICDSFVNINEVTLVDLKRKNKETIAIINYNLREYVSGTFGNRSNTSLEFSFTGQAEFSVDRGRWVKYDGLLSSSSTSFIGGSSAQRLVLVPTE